MNHLMILDKILLLPSKRSHKKVSNTIMNSIHEYNFHDF